MANTNVITVDESKKWAVGMTQEEFEMHWARRYPYATDCIPKLTVWLETPVMRYHGINPIEAESITMAEGPANGENKLPKSRK